MKSKIHELKNDNKLSVSKNFVYFFILFLATLQINAQQEIDTQFRNQTLQVYQNLDKSRVPHGILLDFGMEFTNLRAFNGVVVDSTLTTSQTLSDTYKTLLMCRVRNVNDGFISPVEYANRWYNQREEGVITLSGQYFRYSRFDDNAFPSRINYSNNRFSDRFVRGIWQNPYQDQSMFVMAPSVSTYRGLNLKVKLPQNLMLSNYASTIQQIHIDFGDGLGFRLVNYNTQINVNYNQPNTYSWRYRITLTNGQTIQSHSKVVIEKGLNAIDYDVYKNQTSLQNQASSQNQTLNNPLSQFYKKRITATVPIFGRLGTATVYVRFRLGGTNIQNPLIVAEGFDPGVILSREIEGGQNNIIDFERNVLFSQSQLPNELNTYDIIYVDWDNGVDFLQRNAMVLEEVIKWVNQEKASNGSTTKSVVLGQSMGGLIARYALRDIELNRNFNHDTRLYVSHDAPHLGANVPYSVQYSARHLRNLYIQTPVALLTGDLILPIILNFADGYIASFNSVWGTNIPEFNYDVTPLQGFSLADVPAARQMQYLWVNKNYSINNSIFQIWQQEYNSFGFPQGYTNARIRNISIANGSECGVLQPDNGNILSYIKDAGRDTLLSNYLGIHDAVYGALLLRPDIVIASLFPGKSYWEIDFQSRFMTNLNQNKQIYKGSIKYKKKVFWFIPVSITVTNRTANQPSNVLPYDIYGGGFERTSTTSIPIAGSTLVSNAYGFIPTASALAIGSGTTAINDNDYRRNYVGALPPVAPKNTQFQNFVTHFDQFNPNNNNSRHISFNRRNGNWLRTELNISVPDEVTNCFYICADNQIIGANNLCASATYSGPSGGTFSNWTITEGANLVTLTGNGTPNVTLTALPNVFGQVTLTYSTGDNGARCGNMTLTKTIWVGLPQFNEFTFGSGLSQNPCIAPIDCLTSGLPSTEIFASFTGLSTTEFNNNANWEWVRYNNFIFLNSSRNRATICPLAIGNSGFKVRVKNACGWSEWVDYPSFDITSCSDNGISSSNIYTVYPNPSQDIVTIDLRDQNNQPDNTKKITGELFNILGITKSKIQINNNKATFSVAGLTKGIYVLKIYINDQVESHQIAVN